MSKKSEDNISEKEVYQLWWEYLKRSKKYKAYCDMKPRPVINKEDRGGKHRIVIKITGEKKHSSIIVSEEEFLYVWNMERNWNTFGNIFKTSFDNWWKIRKIPNKKLPVLVLNDPDICMKLPSFVARNKDLKNSKAIYPNPKKLIEPLTKSEFNYIFLAVPMVGNVTIDEISKQIASIREEYKKQPFFRLADYMFKRFKMPISRVRFDALKRYLRVYDLKQGGLKIKEIIAEVDPRRKGSDVDIERSFRSDLQKARHLISNVEHGLFPEEPEIVTQNYLKLQGSHHGSSHKRQ